MVHEDSPRGRGRPKRQRRVAQAPPARRLEPIGDGPLRGAPVELTLDEAEAIRLADLERIYHEEAAEIMGVSRSTYGRILESARHKMALSLWMESLLLIGGGDIDVEVRGRGRRRRTGDASFPGSGEPEGQGCGDRRRKGGRGYGAHGRCVCPRCGLVREHQPGRPCKRERCPDCDVPMLREGGEHHRAWLAARSKVKD